MVNFLRSALGSLALLLFLLAHFNAQAQLKQDFEFMGGPKPTVGLEPAGLDTISHPFRFGTQRFGSIAFGDIDNDGDKDFISGSRTGELFYYKNFGTATAPSWGKEWFTNIDTIKLAKGQNLNECRPRLYDIDNDGDLDLFVTSRYDDRNFNFINDFRYYKNTGTKSNPVFTRTDESTIGLYGNVGEFAGIDFADMDNDGDPDCVVGGSDSCTYFENIGTKTAPSFVRKFHSDNPFDNWTDKSFLAPTICMRDLDQDGDYDMFFGNEAGFVRYVENKGTPSAMDFGTNIQGDTTGTQLDTVDFGIFIALDMADLNGDGVEDIMVAEFSPTVFKWYRGLSFGINSSVTQIDTPTCSDSLNGTATVSISGGTAPYNISWSNGDITATADSLSAGKYYITIIDAVPDTVVDSITIVSPSPVSASASVSNNVSCFGDANGQATISAGGGNGGYSYLWSNNETTASTTASLAAGRHTVTVTDRKGCKDTTSVQVTQPQKLVATALVDSHSTQGPNTGGASVQVMGGTAPYTYLWSTSATTASINAVGANKYYVTVTDKNNCTDNDSVEIIDGIGIVFKVDSNASCTGAADGGASATISGGTSPYSYLWSNGDTHAFADSLSAGTYTLRIIDAAQDTAIDSIVIMEPATLVAATVIDSNASCFGLANGGATGSATGGTGPYTYKWDNNETTAGTSAGLAAGRHGLTVTDNNGCGDTTSAVIRQPAQLIAMGIVDSHSVKGPNTGGASVQVTGGTAPYSYKWDNNKTTTAISGLDADTVFVTVTDKNGCRATDSVIIISGVSFTLATDSNVSCKGFANGGASANVLGGTAPYSYLWSNGDTSLFADSLPAGTYTFRVIDARQDTVIDSITITEPAALVVSVVVDSHATCYGLNNGGATANATGGTTPYTYSWSNTMSTASVVNLVAGSYQVGITDHNGCIDSTSVSITQPDSIEFNITFTKDITCFGENDGEMGYFITGGTAPFISMGSPLDVQDTVTGLTPLQTRVYLEDVNGCRDSSTFLSINEPTVLSVVASVDSNVSCNGDATGGLSATVLGGTTPYSYLWNNAGASAMASVTAVPAGNYKVIVTDSNGCIDSASSTVTEPSLLLAGSITGDDEVCAGIAPNKITELSGASGGTGSITYQWQMSSDNTNWSDVLGATSSEYQPAGTAGNTWYRRLAMDANACGPMVSNTVKITINGQPEVGFTVNTGCQGKQTLFTDTTVLTSGNITSYMWGFGDQGTSTQQNPINIYKNSGTYTVSLVVTTDSGCVDSTSTTVSVNPVPSVDFSATAECEGDATVFSNKSSISTGSLNYSWDLGDKNNSTAAAPSYNYANAGFYTVQLTATSAAGCVDSISKTVQVKNVPKPNFSATAVCEGNFTNFTNLTVGGSTYSWDFADGTGGSKQANPKNKYKNSGNYTVVLTATSTDGCSDTAQRVVNVYSLPTSSFTASEECLGVATDFTNNSSGASNYQWVFGNGTSSNKSAPSVIYGTAGTYSVELTATTTNGCTDVTSTTVTVNALPDVSFTTADICLSENLTTTNTTTGASTYAWNFGDGNASIATAPTHTYSAFGNYRVSLVATSGDGCIDSTATTINAFAVPEVSFTATDVCFGTSTNFSNSSKIADGTMTYVWDLGDGSTTGNPSPSYAYGKDGAYAIKLVATSNNGCKDSTTGSVDVYAMPTVDFTTASVCYGDTLFTNNLSSAASYAWSFGDGSTSTDASPFNFYSTAGDYDVQLIATTTNNCIDSLSKNISIYSKPVASFDVKDVCDEEAVQFANGSYNAIITGNSWDFGDGNADNRVNPANTYSTDGSYTTTLIVTSNEGCQDTLSKTVTVHPNPVMVFTNSTECDYDSTVFTNGSTIGSGTISYGWDFGTGDVSVIESPTYQFASAGAYKVSLTGTSDQGCVRSTEAIVVVNPSPQAAMSFANNCEGITSELASTSGVSAGNIAGYEWDLGDGNTAALEKVSHVYALDGSYTVELVVTTDEACTDTATSTIVVYNKPTASFSSPDICFGQVSDFTDASIDANDYLYDFGDKWGISTNAAPDYTYEAPGSYDATLYVTSANGCKDTVTETIVIYSLPTAQFNINHHCLLEDFTPEDKSAGDISNWNWNYGDGNNAAGIDPIHTYAKDGSYNVKLEVTDDNGCIDSLTKTVTVWPLPIIGIRTDTLVSKGYTVPMMATGGVEYKWSPIENLDKPLQANPSATVLEDITYTVTIANEFGCTKDTFATLRVEEDYTLEPSNIMTPDGNGQNDNWIVEKAQYYNDVEVIVFDRWGRIVYQSNAYNNTWSGTSTAGEPLPDGAYYYVVKVPTEREEYKGSITIFR